MQSLLHIKLIGTWAKVSSCNHNGRIIGVRHGQSLACIIAATSIEYILRFTHPTLRSASKRDQLDCAQPTALLHSNQHVRESKGCSRKAESLAGRTWSFAIPNQYTSFAIPDQSHTHTSPYRQSTMRMSMGPEEISSAVPVRLAPLLRLPVYHQLVRGALSTIRDRSRTSTPMHHASRRASLCAPTSF